MKINWLKPLLVAGSVCLSGTSVLQAQVVVNGFTGALTWENWTLPVQFPASDKGGTADFVDQSCSCEGSNMTLAILGGNEPSAPGPSRLTASITLSSHVIFTFDYAAQTMDERGWGAEGEVFESFGYTIQHAGGGLTTVSLSPTSGDKTVLGSDNAGLPPEVLAEVVWNPTERVELFAGDTFTFYLDSLDSEGGHAIFYAGIPTTAVPEPGEWMALAGAGMIGFAGVRRWRQNKAVINT